ncbi:MAG TPA: hypothetical protein VMV21_05590 [Vicinamibacteria bacterium]|nr:hypothetical protein [Vicinamibacteria bacterium]
MALAAMAAFWIHFGIIRASIVPLGGDNYEYADVARNVAQGRGLVTDGASVLEMAALGNGRLPLPYFIHDPGNAIYLGGFFALFGARTSVIALASGTCFVLTVTLTYLLGARLFGEGVGRLAAFFAVINAQLNGLSVSGLSELPASFLLTLGFFLLCGVRGPGTAFGAGLAVGALVVTRQNALPFVPWFLVFLALVPERGLSLAASLTRPNWAVLKKRTRRALLPFTLGVVLLVVPNAARTMRQFGHPLHGLGWQSIWLAHTGAIPFDKFKEVWQTTGVNVDPVRYLRTHPGELLGKMDYQIRDALTRIMTGGARAVAADAFFFALVLLALLAPPKEESGQAGARCLFAACAVTALLVGGAAFLRWRHLYVFVPVGLVYAAEVTRRLFAVEARGGSTLLRHLRIAALLLAVGASEWLPLIPPPSELQGELDRRLRVLATFVAQNTPENAVVLVDSKASFSLCALAWHQRRQYVTYSEFTFQSLESPVARRPLYVLTVVMRPRGPRPLEGLGPKGGREFARVARLDDPLGEVAARLLVLKDTGALAPP